MDLHYQASLRRPWSLTCACPSVQLLQSALHSVQHGSGFALHVAPQQHVSLNMTCAPGCKHKAFDHPLSLALHAPSVSSLRLIVLVWSLSESLRWDSAALMQSCVQQVHACEEQVKAPQFQDLYVYHCKAFQPQSSSALWPMKKFGSDYGLVCLAVSARNVQVHTMRLSLHIKL